MRRGTYGFSSLMEAINNENKQDVVLSDIHEAVHESASYLDVGHKFIGSNPVEQDMNPNEDYMTPEEKAEIDAMLDQIQPTEDVDENVLEESLSALDECLDAHLD